MKSIRVLIVEDELLIAEDMIRILKKFGYNSIGSAISYSEALEMIDSDKPDIVIIDIVLSGNKDGVDLAHAIREKYNIPIIFATSHADKSTVNRAKESKPNGYLVKPFEAEDLYTAIEIALSNFTGVEAHEVEQAKLLSDCVFIKSENYYVKVYLKDIHWIKSDHNYLAVQTAEKKFVIRSSFESFIEKTANGSFFRVHKSYVININHIEAINSSHLLMLGEEIPIGRSYREELLKRFNTTS